LHTLAVPLWNQEVDSIRRHTRVVARIPKTRRRPVIERRRREYRGGEGAEGAGVPLPTRERFGEGAMPPLGICFDFRSQNVDFWCILCAIFCSSATYCRRKTLFLGLQNLLLSGKQAF